MEPGRDSSRSIPPIEFIPPVKHPCAKSEINDHAEINPTTIASLESEVAGLRTMRADLGERKTFSKEEDRAYKHISGIIDIRMNRIMEIETKEI